MRRHYGAGALLVRGPLHAFACQPHPDRRPTETPARSGARPPLRRSRPFSAPPLRTHPPYLVADSILDGSCAMEALVAGGRRRGSAATAVPLFPPRPTCEFRRPAPPRTDRARTRTHGRRGTARAAHAPVMPLLPPCAFTRACMHGCRSRR